MADYGRLRFRKALRRVVPAIVGYFLFKLGLNCAGMTVKYIGFPKKDSSGDGRIPLEMELNLVFVHHLKT